jgi:hypothetical protein
MEQLFIKNVFEKENTDILALLSWRDFTKRRREGNNKTMSRVCAEFSRNGAERRHRETFASRTNTNYE